MSYIYNRSVPAILILGHGGVGKDEIAARIAQKSYTPINFISSSRAAAPEVFELFKQWPWAPKYKNWQDCFEDRRNHRVLWSTAISKHINQNDPTTLARKVLEDSDIYVGMRSAREYRAAQNAMLFDIVIWVNAEPRVLNEDPSMEIQFDSATMLRIDNSFDIERTQQQLDVVSFFIRNGTRIFEAFGQKENFLC